MLNPFLARPRRDALAAVAADVDDGVDAHVLQLAQHLVAAVHGGPAAVGVLHRPGKGAALVGGAQYGATLYLQSLDGLLVEHHYLRRLAQHAVERLDAADDLPVARLRGTLHDAADHRVQSGAVAASGQYHYSFQCHFLFYSFLLWGRKYVYIRLHSCQNAKITKKKLKLLLEIKKKNFFKVFFVSFKNVRIFAADLNVQINDCDALSFLEFSRL